MKSLSLNFRRNWLLSIVAMFGAICWSLLSLPEGQFSVSFLDVGQGDSILVQTPSFNNILIDGGPGEKVIQELENKLPYFNSKLDLVVLTHPHNDHVEGLVSVLNRFEVDKVLITGVVRELGSYKEFLRILEERQIEVIFADQDADFYFGEVIFDIVYPFEEIIGTMESEWPDGNPNNTSIVMQVSYGEVDILLTGDIEEVVEQKLVEKSFDLRSEILKVPHQGSKSSSSEEFLDLVDPGIAVVTSGKGNSYGHPHQEVLDRYNARGIEVLRTDEQGTVTFSWNPP